MYVEDHQTLKLRTAYHKDRQIEHRQKHETQSQSHHPNQGQIVRSRVKLVTESVYARK